MLQAIAEKAPLNSTTLIQDYPAYPCVNDVLVFKTNIKSKKDVEKIAPVLNQLIGRTKWNIARDDIDKVLRIQTSAFQAEDIIYAVNQAGYFCQELPD
jgi:hypothetical protein